MDRKDFAARAISPAGSAYVHFTRSTAFWTMVLSAVALLIDSFCAALAADCASAPRALANPPPANIANAVVAALNVALL
ncbi:hypothetical protein RSP822_12390 [Ralstonia solanacearum]|nr:hypothetical protein RSP822_12390 [Ralstonia solanacearum]